MRWTRRRVKREVRAQTQPAYAWDRLLTRLVEGGEAVVCRVTTRSGGEILGVLADGWLDWEVEGRGVLFDREVTRDDAGRLRSVGSSRGVYVPGDEISVMSVIELRSALLSETDA